MQSLRIKIDGMNSAECMGYNNFHVQCKKHVFILSVKAFKPQLHILTEMDSMCCLQCVSQLSAAPFPEP